MKRTFVILTILLSMFACNTPFAQKNSVSDVVEIDSQQFMELVYNYEKNPQTWVYEGSKPCIVDFYADWCGPCKVLSPRLASLAKEFEGKIVIYKVNVDKEQQMSRAFGISSIPALLWCPVKGEPAFTQGALPEDDLRKRIESFLLK